MDDASKIVYRRTQIGYTSLLLTLPFILVPFFIWLSGNAEPIMLAAFGIAAGICLFSAMMLYGLTVKVDNEHLAWHLGLGVARNKIKLEDILEVNVIDDFGFAGYGVRWTKRGTLYSVSGHRAIEVKIKTSWKKPRVVLIGTDQPELLRETIIQQVAAKHRLLGSSIPEMIEIAEGEMAVEEHKKLEASKRADH